MPKPLKLSPSTLNLSANLILLILLIFISGCTNQTENVIEEDLSEISSEIPYEEESYDTIGGDKLHWYHMPLTYGINETCGPVMTRRLKWAFSTLENETDKTIIFEETNRSSTNVIDIAIDCYRDVPIEGDYFAQGLADFWNEDNVITNAHISFFNIEPDGTRYHAGCLIYPDVEIHEILHVFGFEHNTTRGSIMGNISTDCMVRKVDDYIIRELKDVYK